MESTCAFRPLSSFFQCKHLRSYPVITSLQLTRHRSDRTLKSSSFPMTLLSRDASRDPNHDALIQAVAAAFSALSLSALCLRLYSRKLKAHHLFADDYIVIAAWVHPEISQTWPNSLHCLDCGIGPIDYVC